MSYSHHVEPHLIHGLSAFLIGRLLTLILLLTLNMHIKQGANPTGKQHRKNPP